MTKEEFNELKIGDEITVKRTGGFSYIVCGTYGPFNRWKKEVYIVQKNTDGVYTSKILEEDAGKFAVLSKITQRTQQDYRKVFTKDDMN